MDIQGGQTHGHSVRQTARGQTRDPRRYKILRFVLVCEAFCLRSDRPNSQQLQQQGSLQKLLRLFYSSLPPSPLFSGALGVCLAMALFFLLFFFNLYHQCFIYVYSAPPLLGCFSIQDQTLRVTFPPSKKESLLG